MALTKLISISWDTSDFFLAISKEISLCQTLSFLPDEGSVTFSAGWPQMQAHNIWFYTSDWQHIYLFLTSNVSIAVLSAVSAKMVHIAQPHCCWAASEQRHLVLWSSLQTFRILGTAVVTRTCLLKEHRSASCIVWICCQWKFTDPAEVSFL